MSARKYSVSEIDQMRENLRFICRDNVIAEDQLRTYMLNGTEPEELARACFDEIQQRVEYRKLSMRRGPVIVRDIKYGNWNVA